MSIAPIIRVSACVLLIAGLCAAQTSARAGSVSSGQGLPDAPSALLRPLFRAGHRAVAEIASARPLQDTRPYTPLTSRQKFHRFARTLYSPYSLIGRAYDATWAQATGGYFGYGGGMEGWGKRLGAAYAGTVTQQFFGDYVFASYFHEDPRYFPLYHGGIAHRLEHAAGRVLFTRGDNGRPEFNRAGLLGILVDASAENLWLPQQQRGAGDTLNRVLGGLQGTATSYVLQEFTPDLLRIFLRHSPKSWRKMEQKIPSQVISGTPAGG